MVALGSDCRFHLHKCRTPAGLGTSSWGWGLPTPGCLCKALPNIESVPRPSSVWQKETLELIVFSELSNRSKPKCLFAATRSVQHVSGALRIEEISKSPLKFSEVLGSYIGASFAICCCGGTACAGGLVSDVSSYAKTCWINS